MYDQQIAIEEKKETLTTEIPKKGGIGKKSYIDDIHVDNSALGNLMRIDKEAIDKEAHLIKEKKLQEMLKRIREDDMKEEKRYPSEPIIVTDATFNKTVQDYPLVVMDCWAPWCGPCRMVGPVIEELAADYTGKIVFGKLNVDENPKIPGQFGIMSIPTLLVFKNGKLVDTLIGAMTKEMLKPQLTKYLE